ncbi:oxysterol-binding protein-related protein 2 [Aplysia californica]|uniref:Oxysterol-binding protein n=1 Tax=Aplysia californica TaxID=6500 RepID=A0ABM1ADZ8_APLCA|nr:oxysterol-binding protein-related protein 2 [Aplysia californica]
MSLCCWHNARSMPSSSVDDARFEPGRLRVLADTYPLRDPLGDPDVIAVGPSGRGGVSWGSIRGVRDRDKSPSTRRMSALHRKKSQISDTHQYRQKLPAVMFSRAEISFWTILKQCIGKELSKITMPVVFNEPISLIQRLAEYMEYSFLIDKALRCHNPVDRMEMVCAFVIAALSSNYKRIGKPFNPVLGETFEFVRQDLGFRFVGEQVSHHPPITAFHATGGGYSFQGSIQPKLSFWGKTVEICPRGLIRLELHKFKETYTWQNVDLIVHNVILGKLWMEYRGNIQVSVNRGTHSATLTFKPAGWLTKEQHHVEGFVYEGSVKKRALYGSWVLGMYSCGVSTYDRFLADSEAKARHAAKEKINVEKTSLATFNYDLAQQRTLWTVNERPADSAQYYEFSRLAVSLNDKLPNMEMYLPPTDSRWRPDIRAMEEGLLDQASAQKERIEEKQRAARRDDKCRNRSFTPRWFSLKKNPDSRKDEWEYGHQYWDRDWTNCPSLF